MKKQTIKGTLYFLAATLSGCASVAHFVYYGKTLSPYYAIYGCIFFVLALIWSYLFGLNEANNDVAEQHELVQGLWGDYHLAKPDDKAKVMWLINLEEKVLQDRIDRLNNLKRLRF